jgi:hypothetical protein
MNNNSLKFSPAFGKSVEFNNKEIGILTCMFVMALENMFEDSLSSDKFQIVFKWRKIKKNSKK